MKIIIYTINDCQFSKQEKEYLASHNLQYEEKNLESNREFLTEMLAVSNNFAGTPVTKIEKDDGQIIVLKGFTKEEFDKSLGFTPSVPTSFAAPTPTVASPPPADLPTPPPPAPLPVEPIPQVTPQPPEPIPPQPPSPTPPAPTPTPPPPPPAAPVPVNETKPVITNQTIASTTTTTNDPLNNILNDLQAKSNPPTENNPVSANPQPPPTMPDFNQQSVS